MGQALEGAVCAGPEDVHALEAFVAGSLQIRLSISDQLRIGFYHADNATQTDASEILKLKELASVTQTLTKGLQQIQEHSAAVKVDGGGQELVLFVCPEQL
ncbi:hypothetical protein NDU88_005371 [Pleurodeles waltl]|uniref:DUF4709 domain-containing protein n=1 Tax=Pleurodeles waltl TaxID=8319 RepID=A0AAV7MBX3_PLEWA|nr:hypothetical protein NDU88_005371 [Pleurodeles waltl]